MTEIQAMSALESAARYALAWLENRDQDTWPNSTPEEALRDALAALDEARKAGCPACHGAGRTPIGWEQFEGVGWLDCATCHGTGRKPYEDEPWPLPSCEFCGKPADLSVCRHIVCRDVRCISKAERAPEPKEE